MRTKLAALLMLAATPAFAQSWWYSVQVFPLPDGLSSPNKQRLGEPPATFDAIGMQCEVTKALMLGRQRNLVCRTGPDSSVGIRVLCDPKAASNRIGIVDLQHGEREAMVMLGCD